MTLLEVCVASVDDAATAARAGADRIELNCALELGGLTPSAGLLQATRREVALPLIAMNRPRPGDFVCSLREFGVMESDAETIVACGADGMAFGVLTEDGRIDSKRCAAMAKRAGGGQLVFHRAFDSVSDPLAGLEQLIDLGVHRILTSGLAPTAAEGADTLRALVERADGRIEILPAAGVKADNVLQLVTTTGCTQVHGSFQFERSNDTAAGERSLIHSAPQCGGTDPESVAAVRRLLDQIG